MASSLLNAAGFLSSLVVVLSFSGVTLLLLQLRALVLDRGRERRLAVLKCLRVSGYAALLLCQSAILGAHGVISVLHLGVWEAQQLAALFLCGFATVSTLAFSVSFPPTELTKPQTCMRLLHCCKSSRCSNACVSQVLLVSCWSRQGSLKVFPFLIVTIGVLVLLLVADVALEEPGLREADRILR